MLYLVRKSKFGVRAALEAAIRATLAGQNLITNNAPPHLTPHLRIKRLAGGNWDVNLETAPGNAYRPARGELFIDCHLDLDQDDVEYTREADRTIFNEAETDMDTVAAFIDDNMDAWLDLAMGG
jgi:hypothetical protein